MIEATMCPLVGLHWKMYTSAIKHKGHTKVHSWHEQWWTFSIGASVCVPNFFELPLQNDAWIALSPGIYIHAWTDSGIELWER